MAQSSSSASNNIQSYTLSQQSLSLVRQIVSAAGWAKTMSDIYLGGQLLADGLPELDSLDWVLSMEELAKLTPTKRAAYEKRDKEWINKQVKLALNGKQVAAIQKAFEHFVEEGKLAPNKFITEIITVLGFKVDGVE